MSGLGRVILHNMLCLGVMFVVGLIIGFFIRNTFLYMLIMASIIITMYVVVYLALYFGMLRGRR